MTGPPGGFSDASHRLHVGFTTRHPELQTSTGTIRLRPEDAASLPDEELRDLVRSALDPRPGADPTS